MRFVGVGALSCLGVLTFQLMLRHPRLRGVEWPFGAPPILPALMARLMILPELMARLMGRAQGPIADLINAADLPRDIWGNVIPPPAQDGRERRELPAERIAVDRLDRPPVGATANLALC